jgi:hypothetical protein
VLHALTEPDFNLGPESFGRRIRLRLVREGQIRANCQSMPICSRGIIQPGIIVFHKRIHNASDSALQTKPVPFTHRTLIKRLFMEQN